MKQLRSKDHFLAIFSFIAYMLEKKILKALYLKVPFFKKWKKDHLVIFLLRAHARPVLFGLENL